MPTLIVQRGHCFRTSGATGTSGEQDFANRVAQMCYRLLDGVNGWRVILTLADEYYYVANAFVAIHGDGSMHPSARGASAGYQTPEGQLFAHAWQRAYAARGWPIFREDNYTDSLKYYYGVKNAVSVGTKKAFIAECGFLTSPEDRALMMSPTGIERVALSIGDALGITNEGFLMALTASQQQQIYDSISGYNERRNTLGLPDKDMGAGLADVEQELINMRGMSREIGRASCRERV